MESILQYITIIGAGNIAHSLTPAFVQAGMKPQCIISLHLSSAESLAKQNGIDNFADNYKAVPSQGLFILSVPDDAIAAVAEKLAAQNIDFKNSVFMHLSGSYDKSILSPLQLKGADTCSIHIMQTFPSRTPRSLASAFAGIETGTEANRELLTLLVRKLGLQPFIIRSESKIFYHLAGVFISNFLIANFQNGKQMFDEAEITGAGFLEILLPTFQSTFDNLVENGMTNALSGPLVRADRETLVCHIDALKKKISESGKPEYETLLAAYLAQSLSLLPAARLQKPGNLREYDKIEKLLREELQNFNS